VSAIRRIEINKRANAPPIHGEWNMPDRAARRVALRHELISWGRSVGFAVLALAVLGAAISMGGPAMELLALN
jgi:hypothetical protein